MTFNKKYAIRKLAIGVASVAIGISFIDGNVLAAPNSNLVNYSSSSAESYVLSNSDETPSLHSWIKDKIAQIDFDALTKDEFYSLVSSDGKSYGDIRKIVSDWKDAKIPNGTYSIKKLTIVDVPDIDRKGVVKVEENPLSFEDGVLGNIGLENSPSHITTEKIVDKENNNQELKSMFYSNSDLDNPPSYYSTIDFLTLHNNYYEIGGSQIGVYRGALTIPYGNRTITFTYNLTQTNEVGTKTKIEFIGDKVKVTTRKLVLTDKEEDEHTIQQHHNVIEHSYQLDNTPSKIVKETPDMVIDEDPGILHAIPSGKTADEKIKQLQAKKTGYVFKVKSYEEDGSTSYRYFRTWTTYNGQYSTTIPYDDSESFKTLKEEFKNISYSNDDTLSFNNIKPNEEVAIERKRNVTYMRWELVDPEGSSIERYTPILEDDNAGQAITFYDYPETPKLNIDYLTISYIIGTKPEVNKEMVENRRTKYRANEDLDTNEKVVQEGKDKFKISTTLYKLVKTTGAREDLEGLFQNHNKEAKEIPSNYPNIPSLANGGVTKETTVTYEESEDKVIEKRVNKPRKEITSIPKVTKYEKDTTRDKGLPNETVEGKDGTNTVTITETVDENTGEVIVNRSTPEIVPPTNTIVKVAAKDKIVYSKQGDDIIKTTTSYEVNPDTGEITSKDTVEIFKKDGAKDKVEVEVIPAFKTYVKDGNREVGTPDEITEGKDGSKTTITTYEVDENTGDAIPHRQEPVIVAPTPTIVSVGAKDKVIVKDRTDGAKERETTKYDVDKDTGKLTENVTTELLSSKGDDLPPVVHPEEFNGGVNGVDTPIAEELPVLKLGIIKDTEGNVIDVIKVDEEPKEIEGYTNTGKVETDKDGNKVYTYEKNPTSSNGTELPPVVEALPVLKVGIIKDTEGNVIDVIKVDEEPKEIEGYINTGKVETDKDGNKVYIYEKVKQEKQKEEPKEIDTENPVVEKEAPALTKETKLPKTTSVQGTAELLGFLLGSLSLKSRKKQD